METRLLTSDSGLSGYPREYLEGLLADYSIVPVVVDPGQNYIEAIQPWDPATGSAWSTAEEALLWASAWLAANDSNVTEEIIDVAAAQSHVPEMIPVDTVPRIKSAQ